MTEWMNLFRRQIVRECVVHWRQRRLIINTVLFFLMIAVFFPLTMPSDLTLLRTIAPGVVWISLLLSFFLSSERMFQQEDDDGVLEQWLVSGYPVSLWIGAKLWVHWGLNALPMLIFCPFLAILFGLTSAEMGVLMLSLLIGSPAVLFFCALASAFCIGMQQKGMLMALILLPLTIPVMIFGSGILIVFMQGVFPYGQLALLLAMSVTTFGVLPFAVAGVLRL